MELPGELLSQSPRWQWKQVKEEKKIKKNQTVSQQAAGGDHI